MSYDGAMTTSKKAVVFIVAVVVGALIGLLGGIVVSCFLPGAFKDGADHAASNIVIELSPLVGIVLGIVAARWIVRAENERE